MKNIACFDVGGTFIKYAVINSTGDVLAKGKLASPHENCSETIPDAISSTVKELGNRYELDSVGICTAGQVDSEKGEMIFATDNLPGYTGTKLSEKVFMETGLNTYIENDVNAAALGEMWKGSAIGRKTFVLIALGTGIGGAIVIDGKLHRGVGGSAGEIGHMVMNEDGEECNCGLTGCYERYASTSALIRQYATKAKEEGIDAESINGEEIIKKVRSGDPSACRAYNEFLNHLVTGLASITHLLDPGLIIIGGGISAEEDSFFDELNLRLKKRVMKSYSGHTDIIRAQLLNDAGIFGACYIALNRNADTGG